LADDVGDARDLLLQGGLLLYNCDEGSFSVLHGSKLGWPELLKGDS